MKTLILSALLIGGVSMFTGCSTYQGGAEDQVDVDYGTVHSVPMSQEVVVPTAPPSNDVEPLPPR